MEAKKSSQTVTYFTQACLTLVSHAADQMNTSWVEGFMTSDTKWIALFSTLATLLILAWSYIPA